MGLKIRLSGFYGRVTKMRLYIEVFHITKVPTISKRKSKRNRGALQTLCLFEVANI